MLLILFFLFRPVVDVLIQRAKSGSVKINVDPLDTAKVSVVSLMPVPKASSKAALTS